MNGANLPFNVVPQNPSLKDLLELLRQDILLNLNCHHIGTIQSFDSSNQTAKATINYSKVFYTLSSSTGQYVPQLVNYPILSQCPVIFLGGGGGSTGAFLTFPVSAGDECLILFNDRNFDNWFTGTAGGPPASARLHSFADGIILVGLRSKANVIADFDGDNTLFGFPDAQVGATPGGKVIIQNKENGSLGTPMKTFVDAIDTFMQACTGSSTDPVLAAAAAAYVAAEAVPIPPASFGFKTYLEKIFK